MPGVANLLRFRIQPFAASLNSYRILLYSFASTVAVSVAIANALKNHSNFYSVVIYLSKSNRSVLVLANFGLLLALLCGSVVRQIFFGPLRAPEIERLYDRLWFFVTESLLAFTIFRDDFDIAFALMFGFLLFVKSFHWLASDRIEWMDQRPYPGPPTLFHIRMNGLFFVLWATDFIMFAFAVESTMTNGISGMVLFASEYAILMASALNTSAKYLLSLYELRRATQRGGENAPPWENKSMWVFYIELTTDFLKLTTYLVFFALIITFYGLPLNIVRDVYITGRSFITRLRALQRYQTATRNMDERYPDATEEEMTAMSDRICIICREEMVLRGPPAANELVDTPGIESQGPTPGRDGPNTTPKKLPCGHFFHFHCLRSWLERQQNCPTCRRTVLDPMPQGENGLAGAGGAPQAPNAFGAPGPQGAQPGPQQNNNGGLPGRLFAGAQPQGVPGNLPNGPALPPQLPANMGWGQPGGLNGLLIQYNIQYQLPRQPQQLAQQPQQPPQPLAPQPLQPPPIYNGFQGPGGAWQPWEMDPRWFGQTPGNQPQGSQQPSSSTATPTPTTSVSPTPTQASNTSEASASQGPSSSTTNGATPPTPREAAASAALRRFGPGRSANTTSRSTHSHSSPATATRITSPDSSSDSSSESEANPILNGTVPRADTNFKIPMVIPVCNFHTMPATTPSPTPVRSARASPRGNGSAPSYFRPVQRTRGQAPQPNLPQPQPRSHPNSTHAQFNSQRQSHVYQQPNHSRPPISRLPPTLTDAQLAVMDTVTREAIDERLRVLEGVSGAVFRCIEDLMRIRSSLPPPTTLTTTPVSAASNSSSSNPSPPNVAGIHQPSVVSATETLDEAISTAREAADSGSKVEENLRTASDAHAERASSSALQPELEHPH